MRSFIPILAAAPAAVLAHYNFPGLIHNGEVQGDEYTYIRQTTNANSPITDVTSSDIICNQGGLDADIMAKTETYTVSAGDEVGFTVNAEIGHPGPLAVYMSRAPDGTSAQEYDGSGDWFKVYALTTSDITADGLQWATWGSSGGVKNFTFTLPDSLPAGDYLMRAEHIALHGAGEANGAQFYIGCAQLTVDGSGAGTPSPTVQFPGAYTGEEPGILIGLYWPIPTSYTAPGPVTWPNQCEDHTTNLLGATSDGDCTGSDGSEGSDDSSATAPAATSTPAATSAAATSAATSAAVTSSAAAVDVTPTSSVAPVATPTATPSKGSCKSKRLRRRSSHA